MKNLIHQNALRIVFVVERQHHHESPRSSLAVAFWAFIFYVPGAPLDVC